MAIPIEETVMGALRGQHVELIKQAKPRLVKIFIGSRKNGKFFILFFFFWMIIFTSILFFGYL
jgi:hypothetical protein